VGLVLRSAQGSSRRLRWSSQAEPEASSSVSEVTPSTLVAAAPIEGCSPLVRGQVQGRDEAKLWKALVFWTEPSKGATAPA
jgi:hypothetical protein